MLPESTARGAEAVVSAPQFYLETPIFVCYTERSCQAGNPTPGSITKTAWNRNGRRYIAKMI